MKDCCQCQGIEDQFDQPTVLGKLKDYHQKGPAETTQMLIHALIRQGVQGSSLLDIGGGIGAIQYALLRAGAVSAVSVEASKAFWDAAQGEAAQQGFKGQIRFFHGNFIDLAPTLPPADVVTLDRVICCYPDMPALVNASASHATRLYGLVYPRDTWWVRLGLLFENIGYQFEKTPFRTFVHSTKAVEEILPGLGFQLRYKGYTFLWQIAVFSRISG